MSPTIYHMSSRQFDEIGHEALLEKRQWITEITRLVDPTIFTPIPNYIYVSEEGELLEYTHNPYLHYCGIGEKKFPIFGNIICVYNLKNFSEFQKVHSDLVLTDEAIASISFAP